MNEEDVLVYKQVSSWETDDVIRWMKGLHQCLEVHIPQFLAHCICGSDLLKMSHQQLEYLKVTQVGHQELLLEAVELLSALEKGCTHDFTFSLTSNLSKKTSQLINALNSSPSPSSRKKSQVSSEDQEANALLSRVETTSAVMMAAKLLLGWLDRNPSSLLEDYDSFRTEILRSALDLTSMLMESYDTAKMLETCRVILKCTAVMMCPQNLSLVEPIKLLTVKLQPREDSGLGFSIQRTRQGSLVVSSVLPGSPASRSGKIFIGVEIVQINDQNVVGWEISKVIETLKASGHEVTLVINAGSSERAKKISSEQELPNSEDSQQPVQNGGDDDEGAPEPAAFEEQCDSKLSADQNSAEPLTSTSQSTAHSHSDDLSSSQGTLDEIAESPASFEGDTDFSGMQNVLIQSRVGLDLHRTSSTPLTNQEKAVAIESSSDSCPSSASHVEGKEGSLCSGDSASLECIDGGSVDSGDRERSYEARLKSRTASDGTADRSKKQGKKPNHRLPPVAYRTQVIGGVVVRVPIKPEEQEKSNQKKGSRHKARNKHRVPASEGAGSTEGGKVLAKGKSLGEIRVTSPPEPLPPSPRHLSSGAAEDLLSPHPDGEDGSGEKGKAVFSECKEVIIGRHTAKQVTVSSSTEIVGGSKKVANPALMVPCFQLKNVDKEGFMCKMGGSGLTPKNWRRRWFMLKDKKLYYYKTAFDVSALGIVDMVGYTMEQSPESKKKYAFRAMCQGARTYYFQAESSEDMSSWMECLKEAAEPDELHNLTDRSTTIASDDEL